jgi:metal-sulfur cluster biosynthetic enzyme
MIVATHNTPPPIATIIAALRGVLDPEVGINLVDLGMIGDVAVMPDGAVKVEVRPTTRGCPMHDALAGGVARVVGALPGVTCVDVQFVYEPPWTPERITPEARALLGWR